MAEQQSLSAVVSSRICHDLISPIGAIGNGLELLLMTTKPQDFGPEFALIQDSVNKANAQIRLYRLAFGAAPDGVQTAGTEIAAALDGTYDGHRLGVQHDLPIELARQDAKCLLLAVMCLEKALPKGGTISLAQQGDDWIVQARGAIKPIAQDTGQSPAAGAEAADVQSALLPAALQAAGRSITLHQSDTEVTIQF